jgi:hypothetical protein
VTENSVEKSMLISTKNDTNRLVYEFKSENKNKKPNYVQQQAKWQSQLNPT